MYVERPAGVAADVPAAGVTVTGTLETYPTAAGTTATRAVVERTWNELEATPPNATLLISVKFAPVIKTCPPPPAGPEDVLSEATAGSAPAGMTVNWSAADVADVPRELWTVTSIVKGRLETCPTTGVTAVRLPVVVDDERLGGDAPEERRRQWPSPD